MDAVSFSPADAERLLPSLDGNMIQSLTWKYADLKKNADEKNS